MRARRFSLPVLVAGTSLVTARCILEDAASTALVRAELAAHCR